jgi:hypothetical protein
MLLFWLTKRATKGAWRDAKSKVEHFVKHDRRGECFGAVDANDYEARAVSFLRGPSRQGVLECRRRTTLRCPGDTLRYDRITREFGIMTANGRVRSYYEPRPSRHRCPTNEDYFWQECRRVFR